MPFGQGPHNCIGMRFAMLEAKLAMARILKSYILKPSPKTQEPIRCDPIYAVSYVKGGLHIKIEKRYWKICSWDHCKFTFESALA